MSLTETITWIPVGERLPDTDRTVYATTNTKFRRIAAFHRNGRWFAWHGEKIRGVMFWAEMPSGPKPKESGE